ncbi:MAG: glycine/sarcosine/betaine reductase selenoprotein B family protein [bacterium]
MGIRGLKDRLVARLLTRYPALVRRWAEGRRFTAGDALGDPWADLDKPLAECRVAIVTTAGVHLKDQPPFDMKNPNGDPTFREIPDDAPRDQLTITHNYYDHRSADRDINVVFPLDRLSDLAAEGRIAGRAAAHLGFMGHIDGPLVERLINETAPEAARRLIAAGADCVVLTPA